MSQQDTTKNNEAYKKIEDQLQCDDVIIDSRFLSDDLVIYTAGWYRNKYPRFPEHYYEVFEKFSEENKK